MPGPLAQLSSVIEARVRHTGQRLGVRAGLIALTAFCALVFLFFALSAATLALSERFGRLEALLIMGGIALGLMLILLLVLAAEGRRQRKIAARRQALDSQLMNSLTTSALLGGMRGGRSWTPSRTGLGLGLVAIGALLVASRFGGERKKD